MLYVSTRDKTASYTAYRTLREDRAPDGGLYVPFLLPVYTPDEITELGSLPFGQIAAQILNTLLGSKLTAWDVGFCVGKNPIKMKCIGHRLYACESWNDPTTDLSYLERELYQAIFDDSNRQPTWWAKVAIRIAVLFGCCPQMRGEGVERCHFAATSTEPESFLAAWYARRMGLPIDDIIYCCADSNTMWDFFCHGQLSASFESDPILEQMLFSVLGTEEVKRYLEAAQKRSAYLLDEEQLQAVKSGISPVVVGKKRIGAVIRRIHRTNGYILGSDAALAYGGLQDYRAHSGQTGAVLMLLHQSPLQEADLICEALDIGRDELISMIQEE